MYEAKHYRDLAERSRRLSRQTHDDQMSGALKEIAREFDELAEDLETGAVEIRHPELMPQSRHEAPSEEKPDDSELGKDR